MQNLKEKTNEVKLKEKLLECKKELVLAEVEYQVLMESESGTNNGSSRESEISLRQTQRERTEAYVAASSRKSESCADARPVADNTVLCNDIDRDMCEEHVPVQKLSPSAQEFTPRVNMLVTEPQISELNQVTRQVTEPVVSQAKNGSVPDTRPETCNNLASEFSKYLIRKELIMSRFMNSDDKPESFLVWKQSFLGLISELEAGEREQLDLLVKYLGPKSSEQARS